MRPCADILGCSASVTTWTTQLTTLESRANEHERYANDLITKVAEPTKIIAQRFEELRKRHAEYAGKLEAERDSSYGELRKTKAKYDSVCQEVESKRKKSESAFDKAKAQSAYQQQIIEMHNMKNTYLIAINVANKQKDMYYHEYVPELMDGLQDLNEFRVLKLNGLWTLASQLETGMLQASVGLIERQTQEISRNEPHLDSMMYIRHNMGAFNEPADKVFEPSPVWHDEPTMVVDEPAKIYLRNVLNKSKSQLGDLRREVDKKRREVESAQKVKQRVRQGTETKDEVTVVASIFALQEELHALDRRKITAEVETSTITSVVGDVTLGAKNHNFKSQTFKIPTNCDLCGERIWGLSAKGFDCRDCGYTCHSKCEMKVPAECPGESSKEERKKLKQQRQEAANALLKPNTSGDQVAELPVLSRTNTVNSINSGYAASAHRSVTSAMSPTAETPPEVPTSTRPVSTIGGGGGTIRKNRMIAPPPAAYISELPGSAPNGSSTDGSGQQKAKLLYTFEAHGDGEISVPEGRELTVLEPDSKLPILFPLTYCEPSLSLTPFYRQLDPDGSKYVPVTKRALYPPVTSKCSRPRPSLPNTRAPPRRSVPGQLIPITVPPHPGPPPSKRKALRWHRVGVPRNCVMSRRCMITQHSRMPSTACRKGRGLSLLKRTLGMGGLRLRKVGLQRVCRLVMYRPYEQAVIVLSNTSQRSSPTLLRACVCVCVVGRANT